MLSAFVRGGSFAQGSGALAGWPDALMAPLEGAAVRSAGSIGEGSDAIGEFPQDDRLVGGEPSLGLADQGQPLEGGQPPPGIASSSASPQPQECAPPRASRQAGRRLDERGIEGRDVGGKDAFGNESHAPCWGWTACLPVPSGRKVGHPDAGPEESLIGPSQRGI